METVSCCPVCGEETPSETSSNATNTGRFVKEPEFAKVFPCFLRVFEVKDPPWFEKAFVFCSECSRQLTVVSELEEVMKEVERRLKESEKVVQDKLKSSESKFQSSGVYRRDQRYWKVRGEFLKKDGGSQGTSAVNVPPLFTSPEKQPEYVSVEVDPSIAEDLLDESEVAEDRSLSKTTSNQPENPVLRSKRHRVPPKRFDTDEFYNSKKTMRNTRQTIKVEPVEPLVEQGEGGELYQLLDEVECPTEGPLFAPENTRSQSSSFTTDTDPLAFAQQLDGGVVEYIKVEVNPEDLDERDDFPNPSTPTWDHKDEIRYFGTLLTKIPTGSGYTCSKCTANLPSLSAAKEHVIKEHVDLNRCVLCHSGFINHQELATHIIEVHQSKENYDRLVNEKAREAKLRWLTPGKPEVTHFGIRLFKIGDGKQYQCSACDAIIPVRNPYQQLTNVLHHVVQTHTELHKCKECGERFPTKRTLNIHEDRVHKGLPKSKAALNHPCPVCFKPLCSTEKVTIHMWSHYNKEERVAALARGEKKPPSMKRKFNCDQCVKKFFREVDLQKHKKYAHDPSCHRQEIQKLDESTFLFHSVTLSKVFGGEKYKCSACDSILESMKAAKSHVIRIHTRFYKCDLCEKRFCYPKSLQMHLESTHKQGSTTYCPTCKKPFVGMKPTSYHLWTHYSEEDKQEALARGEKVPFGFEKKFQCEKCASSFTSRAAMKKHQKRVHENTKEKDICGVCGAAVVALALHMRASHPKEEDFRFICSVCDMKFAQYTRLKNHKKVKHGIGDMLKCDLCPKEYAIKADLEAHRNMHLNIRPFKCPKCPMAFTRADVLRKHKLYKHEGVKCPSSRPRKKQKVVETSDSE